MKTVFTEKDVNKVLNVIKKIINDKKNGKYVCPFEVSGIAISKSEKNKIVYVKEKL